MYHTLKIRGDVRPVNTPITSTHTDARLPLVEEARRAYGPDVPEADRHARRLAEQAEVWLELARERSRMADATVVRKAIQAAVFSAQHGAKSLAVPSKLSGTSKNQAPLWGLVRADARFGLRLDVTEADRGALVVSHRGEELGQVQSKHRPWLRPLVPFGAGVFLAKVTGHEQSGYTLGCNIVLGRVGEAVEALRHALGEGDGYGGDGAAEVDVEAQALPEPGGDGATGDSDDIRLWRSADGTACTNVPPASYYSQTGPEWGYGGAGPAELALSILALFVPLDEAHRLHGRLKDDLLEPMPWEGGVISRASVLAWIERERSQN